MELFETGSHYIVQNGDIALWCSRESGFMEPRNGCDICLFPDPLCLGLVHGVIGRVQIGNDADYNFLLLIAKQTQVGILPYGHPIFRIDSVVFLPLTSSLNYYASTSDGGGPNLQVPDQHESFTESVREMMAANLQKCTKHHVSTTGGGSGHQQQQAASSNSDHSSNTLHNNLSPASGVFKRTFSNFLNSASATIGSSNTFRKTENKTARRICESLDKLFNDSPSFYYSPSADITASTWRLSANYAAIASRSTLIADDRFFWNKHLLQDLLNNQNPLSSFWIVPIIQGFVQFENVVLHIPTSSDTAGSVKADGSYEYYDEKGERTQSPQSDVIYTSPVIDLQIGVISRRSRHRAGTRYKKRGTDDLGHCANYVETEQILFWPPHWFSYVIVRGSVPLYWSQSGIQYHPPPKLERTSGERADVFALHFEREVAYYKAINVVNLLHQSSQEMALCNAFTENVLYYNSPLLTYITFDFNEYCRGMRFENVLILTQNIDNIIRDSSFTWIDANGRVCEQASVFRVNCLDCLDRTNIVEAAICRVVLETQCGKMGILPPDVALPDELLKSFKNVWANNGDAISRQYAGTNALKGDYTRTGEHGLTAALKDGMNSANRYYLNQFQDAARQIAIDIVHGVQPDGAIPQSSSGQNLAQVLAGEEVPANTTVETIESKCENLLAVMEDVRKMLLTDDDLCLGSWLLFDSSDSSVSTDADFDVIMVLSMNSVFIVRLDVEGDPIFYYDLPLWSIEKVECGQLSLNGGGILTFAKKSKKVGGVKITYRQQQEAQSSDQQQSGRSNSLDSFSFVLRPANFRLFSGVLIPVENVSDSQEVLTMICECFRNVDRISSSTFPVEELGENMLKIDRKKTARIDSHPNKITWADSRQTLQSLTIRSVDSRRTSLFHQEGGDPVVSSMVNAPKKLINTFKQFSNLLKPTQPVFAAEQAVIVSGNPKPSLPTLSENAEIPLDMASSGSHVRPQAQSYTQPANSYRPSQTEEWKREVVKQMPVCRTRVIQL